MGHLRHRPQEAQLAQVPQLEGGSGEGDDEVLLALADPDHGDPLLLGLAACLVPQVASSSGSEIGRHQFISHLSKLLTHQTSTTSTHQVGASYGTMRERKH